MPRLKLFQQNTFDPPHRRVPCPSIPVWPGCQWFFCWPSSWTLPRSQQDLQLLCLALVFFSLLEIITVLTNHGIPSLPPSSSLGPSLQRAGPCKLPATFLCTEHSQLRVRSPCLPGPLVTSVQMEQPGLGMFHTEVVPPPRKSPSPNPSLQGLVNCSDSSPS